MFSISCVFCAVQLEVEEKAQKNSELEAKRDAVEKLVSGAGSKAEAAARQKVCISGGCLTDVAFRDYLFWNSYAESVTI